MHKKIAYIFSLLMILCTLAGCGENEAKKPDGMSDTAYRAGNRAVEVMEQYLNMEITKEDAYDALCEISDRLEGLDSTKDLSVSISVTSFKIDLYSFGASPSEIDEKIEEDLEQLKSTLRK